jgi:hypothetical protein
MALRAVDAESLTIDATAGGIKITASKVTPGVIRAFCKLEAGQIRIQTDPDIIITAGGSEGSPTMDIGDSFYIVGRPDILNFRAIRTGGTSGTLQVILEGETRNT